jgi:hypothetical protein
MVGLLTEVLLRGLPARNDRLQEDRVLVFDDPRRFARGIASVSIMQAPDGAGAGIGLIWTDCHEGRTRTTAARQRWFDPASTQERATIAVVDIPVTQREASSGRVPHALIGTQVGPYEIIALLGSGGMGDVYRARDLRLDRFVAIKIVRDQFTSRFDREARAVAALNHPNVCS